MCKVGRLHDSTKDSMNFKKKIIPYQQSHKLQQMILSALNIAQEQIEAPVKLHCLCKFYEDRNKSTEI